MSLNQRITQDMVTSISSFIMHEKLREGCLVGKQPRKYFILTVPIRSSCILELVHSDVCVSFKDNTIYRNKYSISFIDEYS